MTDMITTARQAATMSSREIAELVEARHNDVIATIERLFAKGLLRSSRKTRREQTGGRPVDVYELTERDTHLVIAGYSDEHRARVIDRWQELETQVLAPRALTPAEQLLAHAQITVDLERRQQQTEQQVAALAETVGDMDRAHPLLDSIPNGMESITAIRQRIGKQYGLPPRVIDAVVRDMPHSPRPFAMVRSKHEELNARPLAVWSKAEISRVFERFVQGCTFVTPHRATHPDFHGGQERFQMRGEPVGEMSA